MVIFALTLTKLKEKAGEGRGVAADQRI